MTESSPSSFNFDSVQAPASGLQDPTRRHWCLAAAGSLVFAKLPLTVDRVTEMRGGWMLLTTDR